MMDEEKQLENPQKSTPAEAPPASGEGQTVPPIDVEAPTDAVAQESTADRVLDPLEVEAAEATAQAQAVNERATISALNEAAQATKAQMEELKGQYARLAADFDNYRKRTQKEKEELKQQAQCAAIEELLPVVDNFERARSQIKPQNDGEMTIHKSYQGVYKQMVDCLKKLGVAPMRPEGEPFDPNFHEAVMREATDEYEEGIVIEELMRGYIMGERVLRHAMVKVATAPESDSEVADESQNT
ncbi:MAG: nucleotide exchange factor GrpE [Cyanobacteriota bacterium]|nr:nucleotide exchange factor GrpE [Cyanobacteriota bacterium]